MTRGLAEGVALVGRPTWGPRSDTECLWLAIHVTGPQKKCTYGAFHTFYKHIGLSYFLSTALMFAGLSESHVCSLIL